MNKNKLFVVVTILVLVAIATIPVSAAPAQQPLSQDAPIPPGLLDTLSMLAKGIGTGAVIAFLLEKPGWFQGFSSEGKWWLIFVLSLFLPVIAQILIDFVPQDVWQTVEPYWTALASGFLIWAGSQVSHKVDKQLSREA